MKMKCRDCLTVANIPKAIARQHSFTGTSARCPECGGDMYGFAPKKKRGTDSQKRSRKQEKKLAQDMGGRVQPASGAGSAKGDVQVTGTARAECKLTRKKSYSLKLAEMEKIEKEAFYDEIPFLQLEFQGVHPHKKYVVMPYWAFRSLMESR